MSLLLSGAQAQPKRKYISWDEDKLRVLLTQVVGTDTPFHTYRCGKLYNQQQAWSGIINSVMRHRLFKGVTRPVDYLSWCKKVKSVIRTYKEDKVRS